MTHSLSVQSRKYWMPDELCKTCTNCDLPFTFLRRRHHCRFCGKIFCNACSSEKMDGAQFGVQEALRVCVKCKSFEKSMPSSRATAALSSPAAPRPFVPLLLAPASADDEQRLHKLQTYGVEFISTTLRYMLHSPDIVKAIVAGGVTEPDNVDVVLKHWESALNGLVHTALSRVDPNSRAGWRECLDFLQYVKVEVVPGGVARPVWDSLLAAAGLAAPPTSPPPSADALETVLPGPCEFIDGVMFRKSLPHKRMRGDIAEPRVLLLADALEFDAAGELSKLDTLVDQEARYIQILAKKIVAFHPDVVITSNNASGNVGDALRESNVTLVPSVKSSVVERISRMTGAPILPSVNHLDKMQEWQVVGRCGKFETRSIFVGTADTPQVLPSTAPQPHAAVAALPAPALATPAGAAAAATSDTPARFKSRRNLVNYMVLEGCSTAASPTSSTDCTLLVRGGSPVLSFTKALLRWLVYCAHNLRLERCVHYDFHVVPSPCAPELPPTADASDAALSVASGTPSVLFAPSKKLTVVRPYELTARALVKSIRAVGAAAKDSGDAGPASSSFHQMPLSVALAWSHQAISVNSLTVVENTQCTDPYVLRIRFYSTNDKSLKGFLERRCFDAGASCTRCRRPYHRHTLSFSHNLGRVDLYIVRGGAWEEPTLPEDRLALALLPTPQPAAIAALSAAPPDPNGRRQTVDSVHAGGTPSGVPPLPQRRGTAAHAAATTTLGDSGTILLCAVCSACATMVVPWHPASRGTLQYSVGKYLEMQFYHSSTDAPHLSPCPHNPRDHHVRYFARGSTLAVFRYSQLRPLRVLRQTTLKFDSDWARGKRLEELSVLRMAVMERASVQVNLLGDLSRRVSQYDSLAHFMPSLRKLQERVSLVRDRTVEAILAVLPSGDACSSSGGGGDSASSTPARTRSVTAARSSSLGLMGPLVDTAAFLASPQEDVLAVMYLRQSWAGAAHLADLEIAAMDRMLTPSRTAPVEATPVHPPQAVSAPPTDTRSTDVSRTSSGEGVPPALPAAPDGVVRAVTPSPSPELGCAASTHSARSSPTSGVEAATPAPGVPLTELRRSSVSPEVAPADMPSDPLKLVPPCPPGVHTHMPPGLQANSVPVYNTVMSSIIAYSLCSAPYWKQLVEVVDVGRARLLEHTEEDHVDVAGRQRGASLGSAFSAKSSDTRRSLDEADLPHQISAPLQGTRALGRRRSKSVLVTPTHGLLGSEYGVPRPHPTHHRVTSLPELPTDVIVDQRLVSPTAAGRARRNSEGHSPSARGLPGAGLLPAPRLAPSPLRIPNVAPSQEDRRLSGSVVAAGSALAAAGGAGTMLDQVPPSPTVFKPFGARSGHRPRNLLLPNVIDSTPSSSASSLAVVSIPAKCVRPDVVAEGALPRMVSRRSDGAAAKPRSDNRFTASGSTSLEPWQAWGRDSAFGMPLQLSPESMLVSDVHGDIRHTFTDRSPGNEVTFTVTTHWAMQFHGLRDLVCECPRAYVQSLAFCKRWSPSGGKSGASFELSQDERLVVKYVKQTELETFVDNAAKFFGHSHAVLVKGQQSLLARYLGVYTVSVAPANGKKSVFYVAVLENLFYKRSIPDGLKFDLKGKTRSNRGKQQETAGAPGSAAAAAPVVGSSGAATVPPVGSVSPAIAHVVTPSPAPAASGPSVLLDDEFLARAGGHPTVLDPASESFLNSAVKADTAFLASLKVIDYSLLVGVDDTTGELVAGLVDYARRYDWMSRMESNVKRSIATNEPTVVNPRRYRDRFCAAMERYFVSVPDKLSEADTVPTDGSADGLVVGGAGDELDSGTGEEAKESSGSGGVNGVAAVP